MYDMGFRKGEGPKICFMVPTAQGKQGRWQNKISVRENKGREFGNSTKKRENTRNFVMLSCKFPDSIDQGYCNICPRISILFFKVNVSAKSFSHEIVTLKFWIQTGKMQET